MENKVMMTFGSAYVAPDVQVVEVLVEHGFQGSLGAQSDLNDLDYGADHEEFE